ALFAKVELCLVGVVEEDAVIVTAHEEGDALVERILADAVAGAVAVPHGVAAATTVEGSALLPQSVDLLVAAQQLTGTGGAAIGKVSLLLIIGEDELLPLVEDLQLHGLLVHADAQLGSEKLPGIALLMEIESEAAVGLLVHHCKGGVAAGEGG